MNRTDERKLKNVSYELLYWMEERQRIYQKRFVEKKPPPWTKDQILRDIRFCNVYREQDKVTIWIRENWREPFKNHPNLPFAMAMARQINWPETLAEVGFPKRWNPEQVLAKMRNRAAAGKQNYSGAYMLTAGSGSRGLDKPFITVMKILNTLYPEIRKWKTQSPGIGGTLQEAWQWLQKFYGFGPFLAYEVVTDLRHTHWLNQAPDIFTWANPGPGAKRGLNRLLGRPLKFRQPVPEFIAEMQALQGILAIFGDHALLPTLEMRDVEHSLCEYDKYKRAENALATNQRIALDRFAPPRKALTPFQ